MLLGQGVEDQTVLNGGRNVLDALRAVRPAGGGLRDTAQNRQPTGVPTPMTLRVRSRSTEVRAVDRATNAGSVASASPTHRKAPRSCGIGRRQSRAGLGRVAGRPCGGRSPWRAWSPFPCGGPPGFPCAASAVVVGAGSGFRTSGAAPCFRSSRSAAQRSLFPWCSPTGTRAGRCTWPLGSGSP